MSHAPVRNDVVRIATRQSPLALWQAEFVKAELSRFHPGIVVELIKFTTQSDSRFRVRREPH